MDEHVQTLVLALFHLRDTMPESAFYRNIVIFVNRREISISKQRKITHKIFRYIRLCIIYEYCNYGIHILILSINKNKHTPRGLDIKLHHAGWHTCTICYGERPKTVYSVKRMFIQVALAPRTYILSPNRLFEAFLQLKTWPNSYKFQFYTGIITDW